eukprot:scaffold9857_cov127-Cylindrotheca_fusiformis.AAC.5
MLAVILGVVVVTSDNHDKNEKGKQEDTSNSIKSESHSNKMPQKVVHGDRNTNSADRANEIVCSEIDEQAIVVRLRGAGESDIPNSQQVMESKTDDDFVTKQIGQFRQYLLDKAEENSEFYLEERLLALQLGAEFSFDLVSNSKEEEALSKEVECKILVRLVEAYYIGQADVVALGRHLTSFHKALHPFWKESEEEGSLFTKLSGETSGEIFEQLKSIFSTDAVTNGMIFFRAFCYAQHRVDFSASTDDSLLDAYCLCFFAIQVLQGSFQGIDLDVGSIHALIDDEFFQGKSHDDIELTSEDILWCFCTLLLHIGSVIRRKQGLDYYNRIFAEPFSVIMKEELTVARLAIGLRPESPKTYLAAYRMVVDTRRILPAEMQVGWLESAHEYAVQGLEKAENWGDPFFMYTFHILEAFWLPTPLQTPTAYTFGEIKSRIQMANEFKEDALGFVPKHQFWFAEQHEVLLRKILKSFPIDDDFEITFPLMDCTTFGPIQPKGKKQSASSPTNGISKCANCSKPLTKILKCAKCEKVGYCNRKCQLEHWKGGHKQDCLRKRSSSVDSTDSLGNL